MLAASGEQQAAHEQGGLGLMDPSGSRRLRRRHGVRDLSSGAFHSSITPARKILTSLTRQRRTRPLRWRVRLVWATEAAPFAGASGLWAVLSCRGNKRISAAPPTP